MRMSDTFSTVDIKDIDLKDERYKVSLSKTDIKALASSIKQTGLVNPPIIRLTRLNVPKHTIISGFSRIKALQYNNTNRFHAVILSNEILEPECHAKAIAAKAFQRPLTHAELIVSIQNLINFYDIQTISKISPCIFNTQLSPSFIKDLEAMGKLPEPTLDLIQRGSLSIKAAKRMLNLSNDIVPLFLDLFSIIKASSSKQMEIITYTIETAARENILPDILLNDSKIQTILTDDNVPSGVKTNLIRSLLYEKRFPELSQTYNRVQKSISELKLGSGIKINPPENFEGKNYTISFTSKTPGEFKTRVNKLETICREESFNKIFST